MPSHFFTGTIADTARTAAYIKISETPYETLKVNEQEYLYISIIVDHDR